VVELVDDTLEFDVYKGSHACINTWMPL